MKVEKLAQLVGLLGLACGTASSSPAGDAASDASISPDASADAPLRDAAVHDATRDRDARVDANAPGYTDGGPCVPGATRCHGKMGYQECLAAGGWSESHSCAGYSTNGTASYCAVVTPTGGEPWAACVEPACWYWIARGVINGETQAGVCIDETTIASCRPDGTLAKAQECEGICEATRSLNGTTLGYCSAECIDGARECIGGPLYRRCTQGRWSAEPLVCENAAACQPSTAGPLSSIVCGGPCESGTSRCAATGDVVETCIAGDWQASEPCALGRCAQNGPQAQCEAECSVEQRDCGFDGALSERICGEAGLWESEAACGEEMQCRFAGAQSLGCVRCVGPTHPGGNGYAVADSRCQGNAIVSCGIDDAWGDPSPCGTGTNCSELRQGPSSVAYCEPE